MPANIDILASESFLAEFESPRPWGTFALSYAMQTVAGLLLLQVAWFAPVSLMAPLHKDYRPIALVETKPSEPPPVAAARPSTPFRLSPETIELARIPAKRVEVVPPPSPKMPPLPVAAMPPVAAPAPPPKVVAVGTFDSQPVAARGNPTMKVEAAGFSGSSATPTVNAAARAVQTGGFGDPNGIAGSSNKPGGLHVAAVGSFDLPSGGGVGNGTGGTRGVRGVVASTGFGNGVAGPGSGDRGGSRSGPVVKEAGFAPADAPKTAPGRREAAAEPPPTPVQILDKPQPAYTEEARRLKIEGEVVLRIVFGADGTIHDISVVRGLGHGLDEAAITAARKIRFQPAHRGSQPVDYATTVHVLFQLA